MATKNCPKCDSANPVACKKCACGHVFFTTRRSANALAVEYEEFPEPSPPQEPEAPRRRTGRVTRERPQFYDALQVENQTRRQRELQKRRKASKSDDVDVATEDVAEKPATVVSTRKRVESPPAKAAEPPAKKRRGRPPGLTNRRSPRAQILATNKSNDASAKAAEFADNNADEASDATANIHDVAPVKALQMNLVLSDINFRIANSSVRAEENVPAEVPMQEEVTDKEKVEVDAPIAKKNVESGKDDDDDIADPDKSAPCDAKQLEASEVGKDIDTSKPTSPAKKDAGAEMEKLESPAKVEVNSDAIEKEETEKSASPVKKEEIQLEVDSNVDNRESIIIKDKAIEKDVAVQQEEADEVKSKEDKSADKEEPMEVDPPADSVDVKSADDEITATKLPKEAKEEGIKVSPINDSNGDITNGVSEDESKVNGAENIAPAEKEDLKASNDEKSENVVGDVKVESSTEVSA